MSIVQVCCIKTVECLRILQWIFCIRPLTGRRSLKTLMSGVELQLTSRNKWEVAEVIFAED